MPCRFRIPASRSASYKPNRQTRCSEVSGLIHAPGRWGVEAFRCFYVRMGWLRCFTNRSICRSLADHSCLRHSSFDPVSAIAHSRNTVSSHEPETPGLRELAASWRPEENPCQSGFFSASLFFSGRGPPSRYCRGSPLVGLALPTTFLERVPQRHLRSLEGIAAFAL